MDASWDQKIHGFEISLCLIPCNKTIPQLDCDVRWKVDFIQQPMVTSSVAGLRRSLPKHLPKPDLHHKISSSLFGGVLPVSATTAFWILVEPLHLRSMLGKLMRCTENYLQLALINRKNQFFSMTMVDHTSHRTNASKIEWIGLWSFASTATFTLPPANQLPCLQASQQHFAGKKLPQPVGGRKCFPRIHQIPKHGFLCYRNKET